jgi:hypothetical protein
MESSKLKIFGNCLRPVHVHNRWTKEEMFAPCGKCEACVNAAASKQSKRVRNEIMQHKYSVMFTLTYNNEYIPRWERFLDNNDCPQIRPIGRCSEMFNSCPLNYFDKVTGKWSIDYDTFLPKIENDEHTEVFASCCKKDIQNFLKRLRFNIAKLYGKEESKRIRYYIASEYGPTTLRPHYHGIIFFDDATILSEIGSLIVRSWGFKRRVSGKRNSFIFQPFADISLTRQYVKLCDQNTAYYVAEYVSGNLGLPQVLAYKSTVPFHLGSKSPVIGSYKSDCREVLDRVNSGAYRVGREVFDEKCGQFKHYDIPLERDLCASLFRKCRGFSSLSFNEKLCRYGFYGRHYKEWFENANLAFIEWKYLTRSFSAVLADFLQSVKGWKYRSWLEVNYSCEYYSLEMDCEQTWYSSRNAWRVVREFDMNRYLPWNDPYYTYVRLFDKFEVMRNSDQMIEFYKLFNDIVHECGFQSAMLAAYPLMNEAVPVRTREKLFTECGMVYQEDSYLRSFFDEVAWFGDFYTHGILDYDKFFANSFYETQYFKNYEAQQKLMLLKRNKSKKVKNTFVFGSRQIA